MDRALGQVLVCIMGMGLVSACTTCAIKQSIRLMEDKWNGRRLLRLTCLYFIQKSDLWQYGDGIHFDPVATIRWNRRGDNANVSIGAIRHNAIQVNANAGGIV